jgi:hypothetical protein
VQNTVLGTGRIMIVRRDNSVNEATGYGVEHRDSVSSGIFLLANTSRSILVSHSGSYSMGNRGTFSRETR